MGNCCCRHTVDDWHVDVEVAKELLKKHVRVPPSKDIPFQRKGVGHFVTQEFRCGSQYQLDASVRRWIRSFNQSKNYNDHICCPVYHRFANDALSYKQFEAYMSELFNLKFVDSVEMGGRIYFVWVPSDFDYKYTTNSSDGIHYLS
jgi:hypothetical protein